MRLPNTARHALASGAEPTMAKTLHTRHNEIFLEKLQLARLGKRMRQADLADRLGRDQALVSKVESGERRLDVIELRDWLLALEIDFIKFISELHAELGPHGTSQLRVLRRKASQRPPS
jgi:transcriptional regulator with XRE-family HTH domain